jgi:purine-nucleoside phosphorylase
MSHHAALERIRSLAPQARPAVAVLLGSGWGALTQHVQAALRIPYAELPGFPQAKVAGHSGELWLGIVPPRWRCSAVASTATRAAR